MSRLVQSQLLTAAGIPHGFSTRQGGVSSGCYASLNLGSKWGDDPTKVAENHRLLAQAGGFAVSQLTTVRQVHGSEIITISDQSTRALDLPCDAMITQSRTRTIGIYTADCVPVLIADTNRGWVAAVHAGWRGTVAGILTKTIARLVQAGVDPTGLLVVLGPSIRACCFEVDDDVANHFSARDEVVRTAGKKPYVDLQRANRNQAERAGVKPENIDDGFACTCCHAEQFFSYRRDGRASGQQLSFITGSASRPVE